MSELAKKVIIVTGGSRGIGRACCIACAKEGANVVLTYNSNQKQAKEVLKELKKYKGRYEAVQLDVRDFDQCKNLVQKVVEKYGDLDVIVNNAGITKDKALMMMKVSDWKDVIDTNLTGTFNMSRAAITTFLKKKQGSIINMSSVSGVNGVARQSNYSASKAGIIGFSKALAKEVSSYGVKVNVIAPGFIDTDMVQALKEEYKQQVIKDIPLKRFGAAKEVADLCVFLASEKSSYITGEVIKVDGGMAI